MLLILRTIKIFKHILHNYVFDITSIVKISILEIRYKIVKYGNMGKSSTSYTCIIHGYANWTSTCIKLIK